MIELHALEVPAGSGALVGRATLPIGAVARYYNPRPCRARVATQGLLAPVPCCILNLQKFMPKLTVQSLELKNPKWPAASAATGQELDLSVDYPSIQSDQFIQFRVRNGDNFVGSASSTKGATTAKWVLPNLPDQPSLKFDALLREAPSPANGFET